MTLMLKLHVSRLSKVVANWVICDQKIDIFYNHSYVGYVFPRQIFFILQFVKGMQRFVKISNFYVIFLPNRDYKNGTK